MLTLGLHNMKLLDLQSRNAYIAWSMWVCKACWSYEVHTINFKYIVTCIYTQVHIDVCKYLWMHVSICVDHLIRHHWHFLSRNSVIRLLYFCDLFLFSWLWYYHLEIQDSSKEIIAKLQDKPDLIIGNYSDGNLVASLVAKKLEVTQVCSSEPFSSISSGWKFLYCLSSGKIIKMN